MTDITLEQRAEVEQVLRALEFGNRNRCPVCAGFDPKGNGETDRRHTKTCPVPRAIAALRLSAGADWVLVPRVPTEAMCEAAGDGPIFIEGRMDGNTFIQSTHYDQRYLLDTWERMIAAAPRHEPGEVENG